MQLKPKQGHLVVISILLFVIWSIAKGPSALKVLTYAFSFLYGIESLIGAGLSAYLSYTVLVRLFLGGDGSSHQSIENCFSQLKAALKKLSKKFTEFSLIVGDMLIFTFSVIYFSTIVKIAKVEIPKEIELWSVIPIFFAFMAVEVVKRRKQSIRVVFEEKLSDLMNNVYLISIVFLTLSALISIFDPNLKEIFLPTSLFIGILYYLFSGLFIPSILHAFYLLDSDF